MTRSTGFARKKLATRPYDFRVSDAYVQRNAFMIAAGQSDLVRSRWIERILDNQNPDGSWNYCWYGWCRGVMEFGTVYPGPHHHPGSVGAGLAEVSLSAMDPGALSLIPDRK